MPIDLRVRRLSKVVRIVEPQVSQRENLVGAQPFSGGFRRVLMRFGHYFASNSAKRPHRGIATFGLYLASAAPFPRVRFFFSLISKASDSTRRYLACPTATKRIPRSVFSLISCKARSIARCLRFGQ